MSTDSKRIEALCICMKRYTYLCWYQDMISRFTRSDHNFVLENFEEKGRKFRVLILVSLWNKFAWVKTRRDCRKFTLSKYNINVIEIIKSFSIKKFMFLSILPCLTICYLRKGMFFGWLTSLGVYWKKPTAKTRYFALKKRE